MNHYELVKEFMTIGGQPTPTEITSLPPERLSFRMGLIKEEIKELEEAIFSNNRVEVLDAIIDVKYVLLGKLIEEGIGNNISGKDLILKKIREDDKLLSLISLIDVISQSRCNSVFLVDFIGYLFGFSDEVLNEAFIRVHENNMSKFCRSESEASLTVCNYKNQGIDAFYDKVGKYYVIYRRSDKKILKSISWNPVKLNDLI